MIIYVQNKKLLGRTFIVSVGQNDCVARLRARLMHILYDTNSDDFAFSLKYRGVELQDAFYLNEYEVIDHSVIEMVPLCDQPAKIDKDYAEVFKDVFSALSGEIDQLNQRENAADAFMVMAMIMLFTVIVSIFRLAFHMTNVSLTLDYFAVGYLFPVCILCHIYRPRFTRFSGFFRRFETTQMRAVIALYVFLLGTTVVTFYWAARQWMGFTRECGTDERENCSYYAIWPAAFNTLLGSLLLGMTIMCIWFTRNFDFSTGDYIVTALLSRRDVPALLQLIQTGSLRAKQQAIADIINLAALSDDDKFKIVAEGGLGVMIGAALANPDDNIISTNACQTLKVLLTVPAIQTLFLDSIHLKELSVLLRSKCRRTATEAVSTVWAILRDADQNGAFENIDSTFLDPKVLEDFCFALEYGWWDVQRRVATTLQELCLNDDARMRLAGDHRISRSLAAAVLSKNEFSRIAALEALELLAMEDMDAITENESLLREIVQMAWQFSENQSTILCLRLMYFYALSKKSATALCQTPKLQECFTRLAVAPNPVKQALVVKIIRLIALDHRLSEQTKSLRLNEVLETIKRATENHEVSTVAENIQELLAAEPASVDEDQLDDLRMKLTWADEPTWEGSPKDASSKPASFAESRVAMPFNESASGGDRMERVYEKKKQLWTDKLRNCWTLAEEFDDKKGAKIKENASTESLPSTGSRPSSRGSPAAKTHAE